MAEQNEWSKIERKPGQKEAVGEKSKQNLRIVKILIERTQNTTHFSFDSSFQPRPAVWFNSTQA